MSDISGKINSIRYGQDFILLRMDNLTAFQIFQTAGLVINNERYINHNAVSSSLIGNIADGMLKLETSNIFSVEKTFLNSIEGDIAIVSEKTAVMLFLANQEGINRIEPSRVFDPTIQVLFDRPIYVAKSDRMDNGSTHVVKCYQGNKFLKEFPLVF
ncbi:MAG: hypothetical protein UT13_C0001G0514 [Candidatus Pacebacteria bacterium GW2011_GWF2_38_9]|nr:MAG: hypothetical protein US01_C0001G0527 [candidate division TM6 bacterium GW2011_GWF2_28_16]KKQ09309.1 MAG: hypothetical protein US20_C0008G0007 [Candidatus Pacebacteria bacterium GW2011_GWF1_36_5]KKQ88867.1 MAG: hypothetical protein UT13_C0001G0514 [Candidatus Pacebacteria bacterium GW2011_GWF2_38_9]HAZ73436.1 hypothetical protein [Candidatus Paceibacterota bacterium]